MKNALYSINILMLKCKHVRLSQPRDKSFTPFLDKIF